jgi:hypothetical protein
VTPTPNPPVAVGVGVAKPKPPSLFADNPYEITLVPDPVLARLLEAKRKLNVTYTARAGNKAPVPRSLPSFSLILFSKDGKHRYAGIDDDVVCYSASLLKVGVMYAAHELLAAANRFRDAQGITVDTDFFAQFATVVQAAITGAPPRFVNRPVANAPKLETILGFVEGTHPQVEFDPGFSNPAETSLKPSSPIMDSMIVPSSDTNAAAVINALGYPYINMALQRAGLWDVAKTSNRNLVLISGNYTNDAVFGVPSVNDPDGTGSRVMTTRGMARLFALIQSGGMIDRVVTPPPAGKDLTKPDRDSMLALLNRAAFGEPAIGAGPPDPPLILRSGGSPPFKLVGNKLGSGPIGKDVAAAGAPQDDAKLVDSEASIFTWTDDPAQVAAKGLTGTMVVCWQNYFHFFAGGNWAPITATIVDTITDYLVAPASP